MTHRSLARHASLALLVVLALLPACRRSSGSGEGIRGVTTSCGALSDPARNLVYVGDAKAGRVVALSATSGDPVREVTLGNTIGGMALDACGRQLFVTVTGGRRIDVFDPDTFARLSVLRIGTAPYAIATGRDGHLLVVTQRGLLDLDLATLAATTLADEVVPDGAILCTDRLTRRAWLVESILGEIRVSTFDLADPSQPHATTGPGAILGRATGAAVSFDGARLYVGTDADGGVVVLDGATLAQQTAIDVGPSLSAVAANTTGTRMYFAHGSSLVQSVNLDTFAAGRDLITGGDVALRGLHVASNNHSLVVHDTAAGVSTDLLFDLRIDAPTALRQDGIYTLTLHGTPDAPWYLFISLEPGYLYLDAPSSPDPRFFDLSLLAGVELLNFGRFDRTGHSWITGIVPDDFAAATDFVIQAAEVPMPGKAFVEISNPMVVRFLGDDCP